MFGVKHFGLNYSALAIPVFVSSLGLGQYLPGLIYDANVVPGTHSWCPCRCHNVASDHDAAAFVVLATLVSTAGPTQSMPLGCRKNYALRE